MKKHKTIPAIILSIGLFILTSIGTVVGISMVLGNGTAKISDPTFNVGIEPMIGGGFTGATDTYTINASGQVYHISSSDYETTPTKTLLATIPEKIKELRESFIKSGLMSSNSNKGATYGGTEITVTINGTTKSFYDKSSNEFIQAKSDIERLTGIDIFRY
ncbi:MAG: hypothetical protein WCP11_02405 [Candidatus Saccharibacteria bacterium]